MFFRKQEKMMNKNDFIRKINFQLTSNFFSIEDFQAMSYRQAKSIIKLIAKQYNKQLTRKEVKAIIIALKSHKNQKEIKIISDFFDIAKKVIIDFYSAITNFMVSKIPFIFIYRKNRKMVLRI